MFSQMFLSDWIHSEQTVPKKQGHLSIFRLDPSWWIPLIDSVILSTCSYQSDAVNLETAVMLVGGGGGRWEPVHSTGPLQRTNATYRSCSGWGAQEDKRVDQSYNSNTLLLNHHRSKHWVSSAAWTQPPQPPLEPFRPTPSSFKRRLRALLCDEADWKERTVWVALNQLWIMLLQSQTAGDLPEDTDPWHGGTKSPPLPQCTSALSADLRVHSSSEVQWPVCRCSALIITFTFKIQPTRALSQH